MAEITENENNLNIPRYVDTYEEEILRPLNVLSEILGNIAQENKSGRAKELIES